VSVRVKRVAGLAEAADSLNKLSQVGGAHPAVPEGDVEQVFALRWALASDEMARALMRLSDELKEQAQLYKANSLAWREKATGRRR
jgi:hypothetical protein